MNGKQRGSATTDETSQNQPVSDDASLSDLVTSEREMPEAPAGTMLAGEAGSIPDTDRRTWVLETGCDVIGSCGHKVGEIVDVEPDYIVVEVGFFNPSDLYVPKSAIGDHQDDDVFLNLTKTQALHQGWDEEPAD